MRLSNQVALITGANRGIGRAIALRFSKEGARVALAARTLPALQAVEEEIRAAGGEALSVSCDVGDPAAVIRMVHEAEQQRFGRIDVLVNNAGYFPSLHSIETLPDEEWERTIRMNLSSAFYVTRAVLPGMMKRGRGSVIMMSSLGAKAAYPFGAPYAAAKAGLFGLMRALAAEAGPNGVRVNALSPGVVQDTEMHERVSAELQRFAGVSPEDRLRGARDTALLRRLLTPEDVASAALFLACDDSGSITGQTINVDAGMRFD